jgi:Uma2 family endonuclease
MATRSAKHGDWTVAHLHALPDDGNRYEIIDGALYVTPSPAPPHQRALSQLIGHIWPYVETVGLEPMTSPADIQYSERTVVQPDLFVFSNPEHARAQDWLEITSGLVLAVEVLSPRTARRDRMIKRRLYQMQRIPEYWIVNATARVIERWRPDSSVAEKISTTLDWNPVPSRDPLRLDVVEYFRAVHGE